MIKYLPPLIDLVMTHLPYSCCYPQLIYHTVVVIHVICASETKHSKQVDSLGPNSTLIGEIEKRNERELF